jgi:hypothetical protein
MGGGFRSSRYGNKFETIKAEARKDAQRDPKKIRDLVRDPVRPLTEGQPGGKEAIQ